MRKVSPKAHGAWLGGSAGSLLGSVVIGLIQAYVTHGQALPLATQTLVMGVCASLVAFVGAHVMPLEYPLPPLPYQPLPFEPLPPATTNPGGTVDVKSTVVEGWGR